MRIEAKTPEEYVSKVPTEFRSAFQTLRSVVKEHLPPGFHECMSYGMIGYVVPHSIYPSGYHVDSSLPLPFLNIASQKDYIGFYHSGIHADQGLSDWFAKEYSAQVPSRLDMGKSCVRLRKPDQIPFDLIGELCTKISPQEWISIYEQGIKNK